jgi:DNA sulfur modification protein DndD
MIINRLAVTDFQVFQGLHEFDLEPRKKYNSKRPVILFGGLNGAGKTTTLTAVRLVLYGKQILGRSVSVKAYETYLEECIHRARDSIVQADSASIQLDFTYAKLGELKNYRVTRHWTKKGNKLHESLKITENDSLLSELTNEQCQGFLNELIPVGVSELFFFDGEKIAELADDSNGQALGDAIKKLLGLDMLDTLSADLGIYLRNVSKDKASKANQAAIQTLQNEADRLEREAATELSNIEQLKPNIEELRANIRKLETNLSEQGGAWASTRESEIEKQATLSAERKALQSQLQDLLSGSYPFSMAESYVISTLSQLKEENATQKKEHTAGQVKEKLALLEAKLKKSLDAAIFKKVNDALLKEFDSLIDVNHTVQTIHGKSDQALQSIQSTLDDALNAQKTKAESLSQALKQLENELDKSGRNIARAPLESKIKPLMDELNSLQSRLSDALVAKSRHIESYKRLLRANMEVVRKLEKLSQQAFETFGDDRAANYAQSSREILKVFSKEMAKRKVADLEHEFARSFHQLARKDDAQITTKIDPTDFSVTLFDESGQAVDKNRLSAGEKQIYAISILEALARTSGRKLPIIIDTPLGRLDSKHRAKLVNNYFPRASHQVIILSTDTEVDEEFYRDLSPHISHAYKLNYNSTTGSTQPSEEYFWKPKLEATA